jgi:serine-type D-Ala-D-Ala carboxypeptidase (penicillin-binding protein 5/6)
MSPYSILQEGHMRRRGRRGRPPRRRGLRGGPPRRLRLLGFVVVAVVACLVALLVFMAQGASGPPVSKARHQPRAAVAPAPVRGDYGIALARRQVPVQLALPLKSGLLFDVPTGQVMWERAPQAVLPIASVTKMMTAIVVVAAHVPPTAKALITPQVIHFSGSGIGLLPLGKRVSVETLLYGLMLPSGNDAAIALAQRVAGTQQRFIAMMNATAKSMGLRCTHFTSESGIVDQGNYSCASDLALIAHSVLIQPLLARIVGSSRAVMPLPIKGGKVWLYNNNPLYVQGYPGTDGVKGGYTTAAGQCLVATARHGRRWLGVVLLHSGDSAAQAQRLLNAGFAAR